MTNEVLLSIRGLQFEGNMDGEKIETITAGNYYKKEDTHYVLYEEIMEGFEKSTRNILKISPKEVSITKKGLVNVNMIFEPNKKSMTDYHTPYGNIIVGMDTEKIGVVEKEDTIEVNVQYSLEVNYEHLADCRITMNIMAKEMEKKTWNQEL